MTNFITRYWYLTPWKTTNTACFFACTLDFSRKMAELIWSALDKSRLKLFMLADFTRSNCGSWQWLPLFCTVFQPSTSRQSAAASQNNILRHDPLNLEHILFSFKCSYFIYHCTCPLQPPESFILGVFILGATIYIVLLAWTLDDIWWVNPASEQDIKWQRCFKYGGTF